MLKRSVIAAALLLASWHASAQNISGSPPAGSASQAGILANAHPGEVAGNWYIPLGPITTAGTPVVTGGNKIVCEYGYVPYPVTLNTLGIISTTTDSAKRLQMAVYSTGTWGRPNALLANTTDIAMGASAGALTGTVSVALPNGGYWFCLNTESTVGIFTSLGTTSQGFTTAFIGSVLQASVGTGGGAMTGISIAQAYGTWPASFNSGTSWTEVTNAQIPYIQFKVASSP